MATPTFEEFKELLLDRNPQVLVDDHLFGGETFAFSNAPGNLELLQDHLSRQLPITKDNVTVVGSGKIRFALSPDNLGRQFSAESDLDILVVDPSVFDEIWVTILKWNYPRRYRLGGADLRWVRLRMDDLYWGWFRPDKIKFSGLSFPGALSRVRDLAAAWFNAFQGISSHEVFAGRTFSGRLYRTWDHARLYHTDSLRRITTIVERQREGA